MNTLSILVVLALLYAVLGFVLQRFALDGLQCDRSFAQSAVFEGDEGEMIEVVRNDRPLLVPWLRMENQISAHLQLGSQSNLHVSGQTHCCSLFTLMPYQQIRRRHRVRFAHRGAYNLGNASLTAGDLLCAFQVHREQDMDVPVLVYPRLLDDSEIPAPLSHLMDEIVSRRQLLTDPFLVRGIRPYHPGDNVRDIHWPATARMNETQVRIHDHTAQSRLLIVLNSQRTPGQWGERLMDYEQEEIEQGIRVAATLCVRALRAGLAAGFAANMPLSVDDDSCAVLPPEAGAAREEELLACMARLRVKFVKASMSFWTSSPMTIRLFIKKTRP